MLPVLLFAPLARVARGLPWLIASALALALAMALPAPVDAAPGGLAAAANGTAPTSTGAATAPAIDGALVEDVRALALAKVAESGAPRVEVVVGRIDPRLRLAPCRRIEPYLPTGIRLWGKSRIGLRCAEGPSAWNVYLPITVKVFGRALVVPAGAPAGSVLVAGDLAEAEVDLAEDWSAAIVDPERVVGRTLAQALKPGQTVRQGHLKLRQWFVAGDTVKVIAVGAGFALESEGQALSNGIEGQPARVRTESGRVVTGQPSAERRLEVSL